MSAKCQWCRRKRPEVAVEVDGRDIWVCTNCQRIIATNEVRHDEEATANRERRKPVA